MKPQLGGYFCDFLRDLLPRMGLAPKHRALEQGLRVHCQVIPSTTSQSCNRTHFVSSFPTAIEQLSK